MTTNIEPTAPSRPPGLSLRDIMVAIAILAVAFAFFYTFIAVVLSVTMLGILVLKGLRLPVITDGPGVRRWLPWMAWFVMLAACPFAIGVLDRVFRYQGPATIGPPAADPIRSRVLKMIDLIGYAHLGLSAIAAVSVVVLARGYYRRLAWVAILLMGLVALALAFNAYDSIFGWSR